MDNRKLLIITLLLIMPFLNNAQTVSATLFNVPQQKVYLNAVTGLYLEVVDSVMMTAEKRVEFNSNLTKGMYQIETEFGQTVDFLYDDAPVKLILKDINKADEIEFIDSQVNTDWNNYLIFKELTMNSMDLLKPILRQYDKKSEFYINAINEYEQLQNAFVSFTDSLMLHDNYASKLIKVDRFPSVNLNDDFKKQRDDMIANFLNDVDFNDLSLIPTDVLTNKIFDFLSIQLTSDQSQQQQIMSLILASDNVLNRASVNFEMYKFVFQFLIEIFNELNLQDVVEYMMRLPYSENIECTESQYNELVSIVEFNSRTRIGSIAKNISGTTIFDENFDLYSIENDFTIVYFWSYTCEHCRENVKDFKMFLDENPDFSLVAVSVKGDLKKIKNFVKKNKVNGYFYHDGLEWNCPFVSDYAVTATPSFYLLDKEKKIIFKPFDFNELIDFVKIIKQ